MANRYLFSEMKWRYRITGANLAPEIPYEGTLTWTQLTYNSSNYRNMMDYGQNCLKWQVVPFVTFMETGADGMLLVALEWETADGETCSLSIYRVNRTTIGIRLQNDTTRYNVYGAYNYLLQFNITTVVAYCQNNASPYICIAFGKPSSFEDPPGWQTVGNRFYIYSWDGTINFPSSNAWYNATGYFYADANGTGQTANYKKNYQMFAEIGVVNNDTLNPSTSSPKGTPTLDIVDDKIDFPDVPTVTPLASGSANLYRLTAERMQSLMSYLWSSDFFNNIQKNHSSPMENIISLYILPLDVTGTATNIIIGNVNTELIGSKITSQYLTMDFGTIDLGTPFSNQLEYAPHSQYEIYLPYIGYRSLEGDDLAGGSIHLKYRVDLLSGNVIAMVRIIQNRRYNITHDSVEYIFSGNCAVSVPLSATNFLQMYGQMISGAVSVLGGVAGIAGGIATGNPIGVVGGIGGIAGGANALINAKPDYEHAGNIATAYGYMGVQTPFLLVKSPIPEIAGNIQKLGGIRSNIYTSFSSLSDFQMIEEFVPTDTLSKECTSDELEEIKDLLKGGVIF